MSKTESTRPPLKTLLAAWKETLAAAGLPTDLLWVFPENLRIEAGPKGLQLGFQTKFTPPDDDALEIAYDLFVESPARIALYRLGTADQKSVCILLCDQWLAQRNETDGYVVRPEWNIALRAGPAGKIEEVRDLVRWVRRVKRGRQLQDYDFGMSLATIDEIKLHGRSLMPFERMAEKMLDNLRRRVGDN